jgi:AcrR family transcriptional regulator
MAEVVRPWRGVSAEDRRATRRSLLLEACLDGVGVLGVVDVTVDAICTSAGLSKRYFYESFADRDAILVAALDQVYVRVGAALSDVLDDRTRSAEQRIQSTVAALVEALQADARVARLYVEAPQNAAMEARRIQAFDEFARLVARGIVGAADDDVAAFATSLMVVSGTTEVIGRWLAGDLALSEDQLIALVTQLGAALTAPFAPNSSTAALP